MISIPIIELVGSHCGSYDQGVQVFRAIIPHLRNGEEIGLDFSGIEIATSSFFSGAISNLLQEFADSKGILPISYINLSNRDAFVLNRTLKSARLQQLNNSSSEFPESILTQ